LCWRWNQASILRILQQCTISTNEQGLGFKSCRADCNRYSCHLPASDCQAMWQSPLSVVGESGTLKFQKSAGLHHYTRQLVKEYRRRKGLRKIDNCFQTTQNWLKNHRSLCHCRRFKP
jgi:hypothetical protein